MGSISEYQEGYRIGFELGYNDGYYGRPSPAVPVHLAKVMRRRLRLLLPHPVPSLVPIFPSICPQSAPVHRPVQQPQATPSQDAPQRPRLINMTQDREDASCFNSRRPMVIRMACQ
jgi:hypothetical protein